MKPVSIFKSKRNLKNWNHNSHVPVSSGVYLILNKLMNRLNTISVESCSS